MTTRKDQEIILVKNVIDYGDLNENGRSSNLVKCFPNYESSKSGSLYDSASIDEKIIDILNFKDEGDSIGSIGDGNTGDFVDSLDDADFDEELEFICSLGLDDSEGCSLDNDKNGSSFEDYFNPYFENHPDELAMLSFYENFVLLELGFDEIINEVYFEE